MDFVAGIPIESLANASQMQRNAASEALLDLLLKELFSFGLMQTDPNFANYRWQPDSDRIVLLDFGATRIVEPETAGAYRDILRAGIAGDVDHVRNALVAIGFVSEAQIARHRVAINAMIAIGLEHAHTSRDGLFDFADRQFVAVIRDLAAPVIDDSASWRLPPPDKLFLQRKISGMVLLFTRLQARLPLLEKLGAYT
ncbi:MULTISPECIES: AarF/UbiB family protein [unclassified Rhizobium]|nr:MULTISPECIES: AarF/UbiB family protein [unclassified Rhizobium]